MGAVLKFDIRDGGSMMVNRLRTWRDLVRSCGFAKIDPSFTEARFGLNDDGCDSIDIRTLSFEEAADTSTVLRIATEARLEAFDVTEFLVFNDWNRDLAPVTSYVALDAIGQLVPGAKPHVAVARREGPDRIVEIAPRYGSWPARTIFLLKKPG